MELKVELVCEIGKKQTAQARELPATTLKSDRRSRKSSLSLTLPTSPAEDNRNLTVVGRAEGIIPPSSGLRQIHGRDLSLLHRCATAGCAAGLGGTGSTCGL